MHKLTKGIILLDRREIRRFIDEHRSKYTENYIRLRAKEDAEKGIPAAASEEPSPIEHELQHEAASLASKIISRYKESLELLDSKIKAEEEFIAQRLKTTTESVENIVGVDKDAAENAHSLKDAHKQLEMTEKRYNTIYDRVGRGPVRYIPGWLYSVLAVMIFAGEIPLNAMVFQIFGENQVMTWVMSVIIGLSVPVSAHFIGIKFREHPNGVVSWANAFKGCVALAIIVAALYGLSEMRTTYLGEFKEQLGLTDTLVKTSFLFFWLNVAVLGAAVMIAYLSHDSNPGFEKAERDYHRARKEAEKKERKRIEVLKAAGHYRAEALNKANSEFRDGINGVNLLKGHYDMLLKEGQEQESQCLERLNHEVSIYRHENLRWRADNTAPGSFQKPLSFAFKLSEMKEKLIN